MTYYGLFRDDVKHRKVAGDLESAVFSHWDQSSTAPAKQRPRPPVCLAVDGLCLISSTDAGPVWPESLQSKFPENSAEKKELDKLKEQFMTECPTAQSGGGSSAPGSAPATLRVTGSPDFSNGPEPLDISRVVDCLPVSPPAADDRPGCTQRIKQGSITSKGDALLTAKVEEQKTRAGRAPHQYQTHNLTYHRQHQQRTTSKGPGSN